MSHYSNVILQILSIFFTFQVFTYLLSYAQTIRNIISFALLALCMAFGVGVTYGIHYYPMFILLTYVGAIIVATLFVVLTFDLRYEYKHKNTHVEQFWLVLICANFIDGLFCFAWIILARETPYSSYVGPSSITSDELDEAFNRCVSNHPDLFSVCKEHFVTSRDRSLYGTIVDHTNDLQVVSSNLYTNYSFLFICLTIMLSVALMSSLAILKQR